jgi:hypothetical protein
MHEVPQDRHRTLDLNSSGEAVLGGRGDGPNGIYVALHDVAAQAVGQSQRQLQIDRATLDGSIERAMGERFVHHLGRESPVFDTRRGETNAADSDGVPFAQL